MYVRPGVEAVKHDSHSHSHSCFPLAQKLYSWEFESKASRSIGKSSTKQANAAL